MADAAPRYAQAIFDIAVEQTRLEGWTDDLATIRQAVDGKKQYEEAMKQNMKLGPNSGAHKAAVRRRSTAAAREKRSA